MIIALNITEVFPQHALPTEVVFGRKNSSGFLAMDIMHGATSLYRVQKLTEWSIR